MRTYSELFWSGIIWTSFLCKLWNTTSTSYGSNSSVNSFIPQLKVTNLMISSQIMLRSFSSCKFLKDLTPIPVKYSKFYAISPTLNSWSVSINVNGASVCGSSKTLRCLLGSNISIMCLLLMLLMNKYERTGRSVPFAIFTKFSLCRLIMRDLPVLRKESTKCWWKSPMNWGIK